MKKKKKVSKNKRKFFIILSCYIAVFIITCITTVATLAWFNRFRKIKNYFDKICISHKYFTNHIKFDILVSFKSKTNVLRQFILKEIIK